jgi:phosphatidylinositol glycan class Q protein
VQWALVWLDSWPAGLKLNTELSRFYSHTFIGLVIIWGGTYSCQWAYAISAHVSRSIGFLHQGAPYLPMIIYAIGALSCGGVTLAISLFLDMLALLTAHIYMCYVISGAVYQKMLKTAGSLWNLFRGMFQYSNGVYPLTVLSRKAVQRSAQPHGLMGIRP